MVLTALSGRLVSRLSCCCGVRSLAVHPVDHDVGQGVPSLPPVAQAQAVELKGLEPLAGFGRVVSLKNRQGNKVNLELQI